MGFLSGVLGAVKNDPSVKTYTLITELDFNKLLDNMHNGVFGFGVCIDHVMRVLHDYVAELHKRTEAVMKPVNGINRSIEEHKLLIQQEKDVELFDQIAGWTQRAAQYIDQARQSRKALNNLDSDLYGKLKCNVSLVLQATETFMENCSNSDLHEIHVASFNTMLKVSGKIGERFQASINRVQYYLNAKINELHKNLSGFRDTQFKELYDAVTGVYVAFKDVYGDMESLLPKYAREVVGKVESISHSSEQFKLSFEKTQRALLSATQQVATQLGNFENLQRVDGIDGSLRGRVKFLKHIGESENAFTVVNGYLTKLNEDVMTPLSIAMYGIGEGFGQNVLSKTNSDVDDAIKHAIGEIKLLKSIDSKFPNFGELRSKLQELGIDMGSVGDDLKGKFTDVDELNAVIQKLEESSKMDKGDATVIFTEMATVTEAISSHSTDVFVKVLNEIKKQVTEEIRDVAGAIKSMVTTIHTGVKYDQNDKEYDYGGGAIGIGNSASGVLKLISEFISNIYNQVTMLHKSVGKEGEDAGSSSVYRDIKKLHASIGILSTEIEKVGKQVTEVEKKLEDCMKSTFEFINEAPKWAEKIMDDLRQDVNGEIANGFENVQKKAKEIYVKRKQLELNSLHSIVNEQHKRIEEILDEDKRNGVKGLMKRMNDYKLLNDFKIVLTPSSKHDPTKFSQLGAKFQDYVDKILEYLKYQVMTKSKPPQPTDHSRHVEGIRESFDVLLRYLMYTGHSKYFNFTHESDELLSNLIDSVHSLTPLTSTLDPQALPDAGRPVLRALKDGMLGFVGELGKGYVNRYDGHKDVIDMSKLVDTKGNLTNNGRNLSKVFLTILEMIFYRLEKLRRSCVTGGECINNKTCLTELVNGNKKESVLGKWLQYHGYRVSYDEETQNGELKRDMTGRDIHAILVKSGKDRKHLFASDNSRLDSGALRQLIGHLGTYYDVCHIRYIEKPKQPTTVKQMLHWLCGFWHNPMRDKVRFSLKEYFPKPKGREEEDYSTIKSSDISLDATTTITPHSLDDNIKRLCAYSHDTLIAILGHGQEEGRYAVDFRTNPDGLWYPINKYQCFDMFVDMSYKLYDQLYFVLVQCQRNSEANSWRDCYYGRYVGGSSWTCNEKQCVNQNCPQIADQKANQNANQKADQTCGQHPVCGVKSPLQSFLEDGLQGFLPHHFTKVGCGVQCSVSNHRGIPCKTPMGFGDIGNAASHTQKGEYIMKSLDEFCGKPSSPLRNLCSYFICLLQRTPQTLDDMFAFFSNYLRNWNDIDQQRRKHIQGALDNATAKAYFGVNYGELNVNSIFYSSASNKNHSNGDLLCLLNCDNYSTMTCGRFMQPFGFNTWNIFAAKNSGRYLSWIVYLTETFYNLLQQLYEECCNNCTKPGTRCHGKVCPDECKVKSAYKSEDTKTALSNQKHTDGCKSIALCPLTRPTLARYGFVLQSISNLSGENGPETKRTCQDLCNSLQIVLNNKEADKHVLAEFVYRTIPNFLWAIRSKFFWTTVALWSLSLFYLICVMVGRLDVLHIRSHLRIPSSHKITAQSLLAATQVGRLAKISYLQP
ncbi:hypothetical protein, conserved [Babesia bigemina]|uniref:Uncharacterized protein n=1 Tax=Babesia bigemina TaxID=5866 RepID=A0A061BIS1_BABBI|nr:hypothetical protein, conserved [Babesia bigemina]CDR71407.1 hypothetical protein, conserved [Babesia bigemina]|eukprot:XP_012770357.1 hypothetical protein, conserved [Babesia bigemina]